MAARHVVVDGSNLATEGRSMPSLGQLDQAVREFLLENPDDVVTVVVDASFGHRIDQGESKVFEEAEAAGELVSPPAGAIGRGDAFLLRIADKTGATVLSNDSFQEFHGDYEWLFERGRLIGGKPVPGVGWIFTPRTPVRGPRSREAVKEAKRKTKGEVESAMPGLDLAAERSRTKGKGKKNVERAIAVALEEVVAPNDTPRRRRKGGSPPAEPVNNPLSFITFIAAHPLGAEVVATVESFASHGAFVDCEGARCYVPLVTMGDPPPKSAREMFSKGEQVRLVVQALDPQRRGVELAMPGFAKIAGAPTEETVAAEIEAQLEEETPEAPAAAEVTPAPARRSRKKAAPAETESVPPAKSPSRRRSAEPIEAEESAPPVKPPSRRRSAEPIEAEESVPPVKPPSRRRSAEPIEAEESAPPVKPPSRRRPAGPVGEPVTPPRKSSSRRRPAGPVGEPVVAGESGVPMEPPSGRGPAEPAVSGEADAPMKAPSLRRGVGMASGPEVVAEPAGRGAEPAVVGEPMAPARKAASRKRGTGAAPNPGVVAVPTGSEVVAEAEAPSRKAAPRKRGAAAAPEPAGQGPERTIVGESATRPRRRGAAPVVEVVTETAAGPEPAPTIRKAPPRRRSVAPSPEPEVVAEPATQAPRKRTRTPPTPVVVEAPPPPVKRTPRRGAPRPEPVADVVAGETLPPTPGSPVAGATAAATKKRTGSAVPNAAVGASPDQPGGSSPRRRPRTQAAATAAATVPDPYAAPPPRAPRNSSRKRASPPPTP